jgi:phosphoribosyl 1,2-cyclic phosphodiesterase
MFIGNGHTRILIDAGLSGKEICDRLADIGEHVSGLDAVLISHEHGDHVCGLLPVLRKSKARVCMSRLTAPTIEWGKYTPKLECFGAGQRFSIGDMEISSFTIPHDAVDPVGFTVRVNGLKIGIVTDLGYIPESVCFHLRESDFLLLESNHDLDMLKVGPYPWSVKQRVMGRNGHLSNSMVSDFILEGMDLSVRTLVLGHLSEHNNHPAIAEMCAAAALGKRSASTRLAVADPRARSAVWEF